MFKIGEIRELIRLLDETTLSEIRVELEDMKLHLKKPDAPGILQVPMQAPIPAVSQPVVQAPVEQSGVTPQQPVQQVVVDEHAHIVTSPMVGTFYRSPSPEASSFVDVGSQVGVKSVVCIVEAMKLMNEIEAEATGEVIEVLAQNGQLVEYGQPLFKIRLA